MSQKKVHGLIIDGRDVKLARIINYFVELPKSNRITFIVAMELANENLYAHKLKHIHERLTKEGSE